MHGEKGSFSKTRMAGFHIILSPILVVIEAERRIAVNAEGDVMELNSTILGTFSDHTPFIQIVSSSGSLGFS